MCVCVWGLVLILRFMGVGFGCLVLGRFILGLFSFCYVWKVNKKLNNIRYFLCLKIVEFYI